MAKLPSCPPFALAHWWWQVRTETGFPAIHASWIRPTQFNLTSWHAGRSCSSSTGMRPEESLLPTFVNHWSRSRTERLELRDLSKKNRSWRMRWHVRCQWIVIEADRYEECPVQERESCWLQPFPSSSASILGQPNSSGKRSQSSRPIVDPLLLLFVHGWLGTALSNNQRWTDYTKVYSKHGGRKMPMWIAGNDSTSKMTRTDIAWVNRSASVIRLFLRESNYR